MEHPENTSENALKADAFAQQVASYLAVTLQRFNELQAQIQALQDTQETPNVSFTSLIMWRSYLGFSVSPMIKQAPYL